MTFWENKANLLAKRDYLLRIPKVAPRYYDNLINISFQKIGILLNSGVGCVKMGEVQIILTFLKLFLFERKILDR